MQVEQSYNKVERTRKMLEVASEVVKLRTEGERIAENQLTAGRRARFGPAAGVGSELSSPGGFVASTTCLTCWRGQNWNKRLGELQDSNGNALRTNNEQRRTNNAKAQNPFTAIFTRLFINLRELACTRPRIIEV